MSCHLQLQHYLVHLLPNFRYTQLNTYQTTLPIIVGMINCHLQLCLCIICISMMRQFMLQTYHHPEHRYRSWPKQMTSPSHLCTQERLQSRNTYKHTYVLHKVSAWAKQNNLTLGPNKTTCTLFTPDPAEYKSNQDLKINNTSLPMVTHPKVLGFTLSLDTQLTYNTHIHNISVQAPKPLQMIKSLTATGWGKQKETLMATYKAVMRPVLEYASSILSPLASPTSINKLQIMQNSALRTSTGCTKDTFLTTAATQETFPQTLTQSLKET